MPYAWKIGHVTPIPKSGASFYAVNYRPISVLPAPSKIIERAVYNQIIYHLNRKQSVVNGGELSDLSDVSCGVPQGSI